MEMTTERKEWLAAKTLFIEQFEKDGGKLEYISDALEMYGIKTDDYEIDINVTHSATEKSAWCDVVVKSSPNFGKGYLSIFTIDMIRSRNDRILDKFKNLLEGLDVDIWCGEYLDVSDDVNEDGEPAKKYSVISKLGISPVKEAK